MAPPPLPALPKAAQPRHAPAFDPWNSSSTGHQRAEQRQLTGWRDLRNGQLNHQLRRGRNGPAAGAKTGAGAGAGAGVGAKTGAAVLEKKSKNSVVDMLRQPGLMETPRPAATPSLPSSSSSSAAAVAAANTATATSTSTSTSRSSNSADMSSGGRGIFAGTIIYVNGSTFPHISDHKLKHVLAEHGARMSLHLGRRAVTHVVLGSGGGGGLAGGKADREIRRVRGCGVYFVGVEWVLESVKAGKRLSEARFARGSSPAGQASVYNKCRP
ncbi:brct domain containing protein [Moelleriella libera RCEF 2490]|uniref:Brct domain containing protein n=1 Tax=Moelleriella libera RCEF 2490 TaxID=1081109 RepID=A0A167WQ46_9HYPO|nr:brct domain containing protein [Moelleriella libera RCEF 2490]